VKLWKTKKLNLSISNILIALGATILIASIIKIHNLKRTHNIIQSHIEESLITEESISIFDMEEYLGYTEASNDLNPNLIQKDIQDEPNVKREDYQSGMMIINIEKLDVRAAVVGGTTIVDLKKGPGLYEISPLPHEDKGNVLIAGHRTTYGAWFRHVDKLREGDIITLEYENRIYTYSVEEVFIVDKKDWSVTKPLGYSAITLTSCHPIGSDRQRIIVRGKLK